jgi:hypothetical protein
MPSNRTENLAVAKIFNVLGHRVWEIGVGLDPIKELGVALAVERARLIRHTRRGLSFLPLAAIDR